MVPYLSADCRLSAVARRVYVVGPANEHVTVMEVFTRTSHGQVMLTLWLAL